jgi:Carboxypeptidase regulatory-like domain
MKNPSTKSPGRSLRNSLLGPESFLWIGLGVLACGLPAQSQQPAVAPPVVSSPGDAPGTGTSAGQQAPDQQSSGKIIGTIVDQDGTAVAGARLKLTRADQSPAQEAQSGDTGQFSFANIAPGPFQLTITAEGFATQTYSGNLRRDEVAIVPQITLAIASVTTQVRVKPQAEIAEEQIKAQEKQRVLGIVPNIYVTYVSNAVPLNTRQKFELAWKSSLDPVTFVAAGAIAGIEQANNDFKGYGQGAQGYGKRYGASYGDLTIGTFIGGAILPSLLKQDPRYFYKGTGSKRSRFLYAIGNAVICKGDNGRWQPNYSNVLGNFAAGGISNFYYPSSDQGAGLALESGAIGIGVSAGVNLLEEFVLRKFTPSVVNRDPHKPTT